MRWVRCGPGGLTQISGELATGSQQATFDAMNIFLGLLTDPFVAGRNGGASVGGSSAVPYAEESGSYAYAAKKQGAARDAFAKFPTKADVARNDVLDPRWSVWGSAFGGGSNSDGNAVVGSNNATVRAFGLAAGADYRISPSTLVGFALSGGGTNFSVAWYRLRTIGPVPGRRLRAPQCWPGLCHRRRGLWLAGRHHRSHGHRCRRSIACAPSSTPMPGPAASKAAIAT